MDYIKVYKDVLQKMIKQEEGDEYGERNEF